MTITATDNLVIARRYLEAIESGAEGGTLAEFFTAGSGIGGCLVHDGYSKGTPQRTAAMGLSYPHDTGAGTRLHPRDTEY